MRGTEEEPDGEMNEETRASFEVYVRQVPLGDENPSAPQVRRAADLAQAVNVENGTYPDSTAEVIELRWDVGVALFLENVMITTGGRKSDVVVESACVMANVE